MPWDGFMLSFASFLLPPLKKKASDARVAASNYYIKLINAVSFFFKTKPQKILI